MVKRILFLLSLSFCLVVDTVAMIPGFEHYTIDPEYVHGDFSPDGTVFINITEFKSTISLRRKQLLSWYTLTDHTDEHRFISHVPDCMFRPNGMSDDEAIVALQWSRDGRYVAVVGRDNIDTVYIYDAYSFFTRYKCANFNLHKRGALLKKIELPEFESDAVVLTWNTDNRNLAVLRYFEFPEDSGDRRVSHELLIVDAISTGSDQMICISSLIEADDYLMPMWDVDGDILALVFIFESGVYSFDDACRVYDKFRYFNRERYELESLDWQYGDQFFAEGFCADIFLRGRKFFHNGLTQLLSSSVCYKRRVLGDYFVSGEGIPTHIARVVDDRVIVSSTVQSSGARLPLHIMARFHPEPIIGTTILQKHAQEIGAAVGAGRCHAYKDLQREFRKRKR